MLKIVARGTGAGFAAAAATGMGGSAALAVAAAGRTPFLASRRIGIVRA
jgi:hypothetical protein